MHSEGILALAETAVPLKENEDIREAEEKEKEPVTALDKPESTGLQDTAGNKLRIAVAKDAAFCFLYEDNLEYLRANGCELVFFSPLSDKKLPEKIDGLLLYGGYPELHTKALSENETLKSEIKEQTSGVTPSSGTLKVFRATKSGLDIKVATLQSEEIRDDAEVADFRLGARHVEGTATGELSYETFDDLLGGALRGTFAGEVLTAGIERQSFTFIDYNADITDFPYTIYRGCEVNSLAITVSAEAITGVEFGIVGRTMEQAATLPSGLSKGTRTTTPPMDGFSGKLAMGDVSVDVITEMAINLENGIEPRFVVGSKFSIKPSSKRRQISGTLTAYYEDNKLRSKFLNEQESDLTIDILDGTTGAGYRFSMPRIKITEAPRPIDGEGDIMLNMSYTGLLDQDEGYSIRITKLPPMSFTTDLTGNKAITIRTFSWCSF